MCTRSTATIVLVICFASFIGRAEAVYLPADRDLTARPRYGWPSFRGHDGTGSTGEAVLTARQPQMQQAWSVSIPGYGHSTPVIRGGSVYLSTAYESDFRSIVSTSIRWFETIAVVLVAWIALSRAASQPHPCHLHFGTAFCAGVLFMLVSVAPETLAAQNDHIRCHILMALIWTASLATARMVAVDNRRWGRILAASGCLATAVLFGRLLAIPFWRAPNILISASCLPLVPALQSLVDLLPVSKHNRHSLSAVVVGVGIGGPLTIFMTVCYRHINLQLWKTQPHPRIEIATVNIAVLVIALALTILLLLVGSKFWRVRSTGWALLGFTCVIALPVVSAPLINAFEYMQYHLVRRPFGSALGITGFVLSSGCLLAGAGLPLLPSRWWRWAARIAPGVAVSLTLLAGLGIYVDACIGGQSGAVCAIVAINAETGAIRWICEGLRGNPGIQGNAFNSSATPTPIVDEHMVVAYFGACGAFACETMAGQLLWVYEELPCRSPYGVGSSLANIDSAVVVQSDSTEQESYVVALSKNNGRPVWRMNRDTEASWRTPLVFRYDDQLYVCAWGTGSCDILEAKSGRVVRRIPNIDCGYGDHVSSPFLVDRSIGFAGQDTLYVVSFKDLVGNRRVEKNKMSESTEDSRVVPTFCLSNAVAIALDGDGPNCVTPLAYGGYVYAVSDEGTLLCTGIDERKPVWKDQVGTTRSSPVVAGQYLYTISLDGRLHAFRLSGERPIEKQTYDLHEVVTASPAIWDGSLFIRTESKLVRIRATEQTVRKVQRPAQL